MNSILLQTSVNDFLNQSSTWMTKIQEFIVGYGLKIVGAFLIYLIGNWIIKRVIALLGRSITNKKFDTSLSKFLLSLTKVTLQLLLFLSIAGVLGINVMGFSAILAGAAVGIGAALNGSLGNLAGGVMMMIFKPFKVGDVIEAQGNLGTVQELGIFNTVILTPDNLTVILPNGALSTGVIKNFNTESGYMRVDINMAIADDQDVDKARAIAVEVMKKHPKVKDNPTPTMAISSVSDFMTKIILLPYAHQDDYWDVYFGITEEVKKAFAENGIAGPTPTHIVFNK